MADFVGRMISNPPRLAADFDGDTFGRLIANQPRRAGFAFGGGGGGGAPPVVTFVDPLPGQPVQAAQGIIVTVTDVDADISLICLSADLGELDEVVSRGLVFSARYESSTVDAIANGWRYTIRRTDGWPAPPTIYVLVSDATGNVV